MIDKSLVINYHLDFPFDVFGNKKGMGVLADQIREDHGNYIGFKNKKELADFIFGEIYGSGSGACANGAKIKESKIKKIVEKTVADCRKASEDNLKLAIHIFPSYNKFINTKMSGASGYTSDSRNILIFLSPQKNWPAALKNTLAHEFAHTKTFKNHSWRTLLDSLIFEGLADNFRESTVGGKPAPWSSALSQTAAKKLFNEMKEKLNSKSKNTYSRIFLGSDRKYPLWSGYAIGYRIAKSYLRYNKKKSWPEIFRTKPEEILKQSKY